MRRSHTLSLAAAALVLAVGASGCDGGGGGGNGERRSDADDPTRAYAQAVIAAQRKVTKAVFDARAEDRPRGAEGLDAAAKDFRRIFEDGAKRLEAIEPPPEVAKLHRQAVAALRKGVTEIEAAREAFATGDLRQVIDGARQLRDAIVTAMEELRAATEKIFSKLGQQGRSPAPTR